jgi:hypothetical protein
MSNAEADLRKEGSCWTSQSRRLDITAYGNVLAHATIRNSRIRWQQKRNSGSDFQAECQSKIWNGHVFLPDFHFLRNTRDSCIVACKRSECYNEEMETHNISNIISTCNRTRRFDATVVAP